jgi:hypothetical protein
VAHAAVDLNNLPDKYAKQLPAAVSPLQYEPQADYVEPSHMVCASSCQPYGLRQIPP